MRHLLVITALFSTALSLFPTSSFAESGDQPPQTRLVPHEQRNLLFVKGPGATSLKTKIIDKTRLIGQEIIASETELEKALDKTPRSLRSPIHCLASYSDGCSSPQQMIYEQLDIRRIIKVELQARKKGEPLIASMQVFVNDQLATQKTVQGASSQEVADSIVRLLFGNIAQLEIKSNPPATVWINGQKQNGTTPIKVSVRAGTTDLRLVADGYQGVTRKIETEPNMGYVLTYELPPATSILRVMNAPEKAQVYLDGRLLGRADQAYPVKEGRYLVEVYAEGFQPYSEYVTIYRGTNASLEVPRLIPKVEDPHASFFALNPVQTRFVGILGWTRLNLDRFVTSSGTWVSPKNPRTDPVGAIPTHANTNFPPIDRVSLGVGADFSYTYKYFALTALSASLVGMKLDIPVDVHLSREGVAPGQEKLVKTSLNNLVMLRLTPLAVGFRYPTKYFVLGIDAGIGLHFDFASIDGVDESFNNFYATTHLEAFGNIYLNPSFFYTLGVRTEFDISSDKTVSHMQLSASFGVGFSFEDFFGIHSKPPASLTPTETSSDVDVSVTETEIVEQ